MDVNVKVRWNERRREEVDQVVVCRREECVNSV